LFTNEKGWCWKPAGGGSRARYLKKERGAKGLGKILQVWGKGDFLSQEVEKAKKATENPYTLGKKESADKGRGMEEVQPGSR